METLDSIVGFLNGWIWSPALVYLCLGAGLYFSIRSRFLQVRGIKDMVKLMVDGKDSKRGISSFGALTVALSGRVGTGNIAGVATAIAFGGPGAVFWMWVIAFLGASTAFIESTLGQIYKVEYQGEYRGGPAFFIEKGLKLKWYAVIFAVATAVGMGVLLPGVQANAISAGLRNAFGLEQYIAGIVTAAVIGMIIFGGVKRIAKFAELVVPFMAILYIVMAIVIFVLKIDKIGEVFGLIFSSAFGSNAAFGGIIGSAISWGVKRGIYSNEAGQGTGPHASSAAEVSHPAKQGLVQAFSVYIDTLFVCSATAFMILSTGMYNSFTGESTSGTPIVENIPGVEVGPGYTQEAVNSVFPGFGPAFVAIALCFFAFTTLLAYYYMGETNLSYLNGDNGPRQKKLFIVYRAIYLVIVFLSTLYTASTAWAMADVAVGLMAWLNIIAILILQKPAWKALKDYEEQKKAGKEKITFDPEALGIENADIWKSIE